MKALLCLPCLVLTVGALVALLLLNPIPSLIPRPSLPSQAQGAPTVPSPKVSSPREGRGLQRILYTVPGGCCGGKATEIYRALGDIGLGGEVHLLRVERESPFTALFEVTFDPTQGDPDFLTSLITSKGGRVLLEERNGSAPSRP